MSTWTRIKDIPKETKRLGAAALALVVAVGAAGAAGWLTWGGEEDPRGQARAVDVTGMEGMDMGVDRSVRLTAEQIRSFGITFGSVELRALDDEIRTVGIIDFDETRMVGVTLKFSGYIERLYVDFTGQPVRRGQPLLEIYSPELVAAQEELLLAARLEETLGQSTVPGLPPGPSNLVVAARQRLRLWDVPDEQVDEILMIGRARRTLPIQAPTSGVVVEKNVLAGQAVHAGQPLYTIADLSEVWVEAELRETDAALIREGDFATVELAALPGRPITGRVEYVYPTLQRQARTLKVRVAVPNPDGVLKPGMYATVVLRSAGRTALTVPISAVLNTGERRVVFVDLGGGELLPQEVETGRVAGDWVEVLAGLEPGQRVVTSAQYLLDSESNLGEVMRSMIGMGAPMDMDGMDMGGSGMEGMDMPRPEE